MVLLSFRPPSGSGAQWAIMFGISSALQMEPTIPGKEYKFRSDLIRSIHRFSPDDKMEDGPKMAVTPSPVSSQTERSVLKLSLTATYLMIGTNSNCRSCMFTRSTA